MPELTYREALRQALREEMLRDPSVYVIGEEVGRFEGSYKVTQGLFKEFGPRRVKEAPIAEEGFMGIGVGSAMLGLRPVVEIMTLNFILVAIDMVINHAAKVRYMFGGQLKVPMVIRTPGGSGKQLTAQHSQSFEGWFANTPGLKVVAPSNPADAKGLLKSAIRDDDPVLFLENLTIYNQRGEVPDGDYVVPIGLAAVPRVGTDLTIVSHSFATVRALQVAERFAEEGISVEVVDLRSLRPLDMETVVKSVRKTHRVLCVEEVGPPTASRPKSQRGCQRRVSPNLTHQSSELVVPKCPCRTPVHWKTPRRLTTRRSMPPRAASLLKAACSSEAS